MGFGLKCLRMSSRLLWKTAILSMYRNGKTHKILLRIFAHQPTFLCTPTVNTHSNLIMLFSSHNHICTYTYIRPVLYTQLFVLMGCFTRAFFVRTQVSGTPHSLKQCCLLTAVLNVFGKFNRI